MKITKRQLRRILEEEVADLEYSDSNPAPENMLDHEDVEDVEPEEDAWAGGSNLVNPVDYEGEVGSGGSPSTGISILKVTENQLRRIIREEKQKLLREAFDGPFSRKAADDLAFAMDEFIASRVKEGEEDASQLRIEIVEIADSVLADAELGDGSIDASRYITLRDPEIGR